MSRKPPPLLRLSEMVPGQLADCFAVLAERKKGATREGKPYYLCRFRDLRRTVSLMVWEDGAWYEACETRWREGQFYKLRATYAEHEKYGPQVEVHNLRETTEADKADGLDRANLVAGSRFDAAEMFAELTGIVEAEMADEPLRRLVLTLLQRHAEALQRQPATRRHYYPFPGGLLEHVLSVTRNCLWLADRYLAIYKDLKPPLNRDVVLAGAVLHDLGRVLEYTAEAQPMQLSTPGRLFGHLFLGRDLVRDAARELGDVNPELVQLVEHLIVSHLNNHEGGAPRPPLVPECLILHHADDLDAQMEMYARCLNNDTEDAPFTARDPTLGRQLFKGRSV